MRDLSLLCIGRRPARRPWTVLIAPAREESATVHWTQWVGGGRFYAFLFSRPC
jgi:hypothetical protein